MTEPGRRLLFGGGCRQRPARSRRHAPAPHKTEGAFYIWSDAEIGALLGDDADIARRRFGIEPAGNAPHDPHGEFTGKNLLYIAQSIAGRRGAHRPTAEADVPAALERIREGAVRRARAAGRVRISTTRCSPRGTA